MSSSQTTAISSGVPVIPGSDGPVTDMETAEAFIDKHGLPIIIKAAMGGTQSEPASCPLVIIEQVVAEECVWSEIELLSQVTLNVHEVKPYKRLVMEPFSWNVSSRNRDILKYNCWAMLTYGQVTENCLIPAGKRHPCI